MCLINWDPNCGSLSIGANKFVKIDRYTMAKDDDEDLPDKDAAKGFYAKYEPKEILGRFVHNDMISVWIWSMSIFNENFKDIEELL